MRATTPTAIVPLKAGPRAKARLAHVLGPAERDVLSRTLACHVVEMLTSCGLPTFVVLAGSPLEAARLVDAEAFASLDPRGRALPAGASRRGLNGELEAALAMTGTPAVVVPSDLPWLTARSVEDVLAVAGDVVVARTRDGGTGALLLRSPVGLAFGRGSALAHARTARVLALDARIVDIDGFHRDLDDESALIASTGAPALRVPWRTATGRGAWGDERLRPPCAAGLS